MGRIWKWLVAVSAVSFLLAGVSCVSAETVVEAWRSPSGEFSGADYLSVNPTDGSCWVGDTASPQGVVHNEVVHLSAAGAELWRSAPGAFSWPYGVSVNSTDGSCWVADWKHSQVVHLSAVGAELWRSASGAFDFPVDVSVNPTDGSCWVADTWNSRVVHLSAAGAELWRSAGGAFSGPYGISANSADGSCWVGDGGANEVVHLSASGAELWRSAPGAFDQPNSVSVNPRDGSCWVADLAHNQVVHLSASGAELWRSASGEFSIPRSVSVNPTDGSCWAADTGDNQVVHLSAAGLELWRSTSGQFSGSAQVSANGTDDSCWVSTGDEVVKLGMLIPPRADFFGTPTSGLAPLVVHFADQSTGSPTAWAWGFGDESTASVQNPSHTYARPGLYAVSLTVSNAAGSDTATKPHYILVSFKDVPVQPPFWALDQILACVDAGIVSGYPDGSYGPTNPVTRDQMAVFVARALAGGEAKVPSAPASASFPDVPTDFWAFRYIEYCKEKGIVTGYPDGLYHPADPVTRAQMAVFITRCFTASPTAPAEAVFPDVPADYWAASYIAYCKDEGIVQGFPDGTYQPEVVVTRDQMAVYVARAFKLDATMLVSQDRALGRKQVALAGLRARLEEVSPAA